eukprot:TRINITY_DN2229_c1_g1_i4.p1 TRINITY_DN2229_c1_g1~~TRINITY_DN2229_c1_g1_i4.p1  ORF type:complete len:2745 (+),score=843.60 TRINITY_DN2229_c1_g1_i4:83-8236(+)
MSSDNAALRTRTDEVIKIIEKGVDAPTASEIIKFISENDVDVANPTGAYFVFEMLPRLIAATLSSRPSNGNLMSTGSLLRPLLLVAAKNIQHADAATLLNVISDCFNHTEKFFKIHYSVEKKAVNDDYAAPTPDKDKDFAKTNFAMSSFCMDCVLAFCSYRGFESVANRLSAELKRRPSGPSQPAFAAGDLTAMYARGALRAFNSGSFYVKPEAIATFSKISALASQAIILNAPNDQLRPFSASDVTTLGEIVSTLARFDKDGSTKIVLQLANKFLRSGFLDKRVQAMQAIKEKFNEIVFPTSAGGIHIAPSESEMDILLDFLVKNDIAGYLVGDQAHIELLKRASEIFSFLSFKSSLPFEYVEKLWSLSLKHSSNAPVVREIISRMAVDSPFAFLKELEAFITKNLSPITVEGANFLAMFATNSARNKNNKTRELLGFPYLISSVQDGSKNVTTFDLASGVLNEISKSLDYEVSPATKCSLMGDCLASLKNGASVFQSFKIANSILLSRTAKESSSSFIPGEPLDALKAGIIPLQNLCEEMKVSPSSLDTLQTASLFTKKSIFIEGFKFIGQLCSDFKIVYPAEDFEKFWGSFGSILSSFEGSLFLDWTRQLLKQSNGKEKSEFVGTAMKLISSLPHSNYSKPALKTALIALKKSWEAIGAVIYTSPPGYPTMKRISVVDPQVLCNDTLWGIVLCCTDDDVFTVAVRKMADFLERISSEAKAKEQDIRTQWVEKCLSALEKDGPLTARRAVDTLTFLLRLESKIDYQPHGARLMKKIIEVKKIGADTYFAKGTPIEVPRFGTSAQLKALAEKQFGVEADFLLTDGKKLQGKERLNNLNNIVFFKEKQASAVTPAPKSETPPSSPISPLLETPLPPFSFVQLISAQLPRLFAKLSSTDNDLLSKLWPLVIELPSLPSLKESLSLNGSELRDWNSAMDKTNSFKMLYGLLSVRDMIEKRKSEMDCDGETNWQQQFSLSGGIDHIVAFICGSKDVFGVCSKSTNAIANATLTALEVAFDCLLQSERRFQARNDLGEQCILILDSAAAWLKSASDLTLIPVVVKLCSKITSLLANVLFENESLMSSVLSSNTFLSNTLLTCSVSGIRACVSGLLSIVCEKNPKMAPLLLSQLLNLVSLSKTNSRNAQEYYNLLAKLLSLPGTQSLKSSELLVSVIQLIKEREITETRGCIHEDKMLSGLLDLCATILVSAPTSVKELAAENGLIDEILVNCLFSHPTMENHGAIEFPKCKHDVSRGKAYNVLSKLCRQSPKNMAKVISLLTKKIEIDEHIHNGYQRSIPILRTAPYSGLRNLGATCYINSTLQQLYMVKEFREGVLNIRLPKQTSEKDAPMSMSEYDIPPEESEIYQFMKLFASMQTSIRRSVSTRSFLSKLKFGSDGINPYVQMDAEEFLSRLADKIENICKGTEQETLFSRVIGGQTCHQIVSKSCEHVSERSEPFVNLSVSVLNKENLIQSMQEFITGDILDGENQYHCSKCNAKVDAVKRTCIQKLPDTLAIHLKRFEFNMETFVREKVNTRYEFPLNVNLYDYTKEGIQEKEEKEKAEKAEKGKDEADGASPASTPSSTPAPESEMETTPQPKLEKLNTPENCEYELMGVLVHSGTAEGGHYYSFIRERNAPAEGVAPRWFEFNDSTVSEITADSLASRCFGGEEEREQWDEMTRQMIRRTGPKFNNAYMLFYQRKQSLPLVSKADPIIPSKILKEVWEDSEYIFFDSILFSEGFSSFFHELATGIIEESKSSPGDYPAEMVFEMGQQVLLFTLEIISHAHLKLGDHRLEKWWSIANDYISISPDLSEWFITTIVNDDMRWVFVALLQAPQSDVRTGFMLAVCTALKSLVVSGKDQLDKMGFKKKDEKMEENEDAEMNANENALVPTLEGIPISVASRFMDKLFSLLPTLGVYKQAPAYFNLLDILVSLTPEFGEFAASRNLALRIADCALGHDSPFHNDNRELYFKEKEKDSKEIPLDPSPIVDALANAIFRQIKARSSSSEEFPTIESVFGKEGSLLVTQPFLKTLAKNVTMSENAYMTMLKSFVTMDQPMERVLAPENNELYKLQWDNFSKIAVKMFDDLSSDHLPAAFGFLKGLILYSATSEQKVELVKTLITLLMENSKYPVATATSLEFFAKFCKMDPIIKSVFVEEFAVWGKLLTETGNQILTKYSEARYQACELMRSLLDLPSAKRTIPLKDQPTVLDSEILESFEVSPPAPLPSDPAQVEALKVILKATTGMFATLDTRGDATMQFPMAGFMHLVYDIARVLGDEGKQAFRTTFGGFMSVLRKVISNNAQIDDQRLWMVLLLDYFLTDCPENVKALLSLSPEMLSCLVQPYLVVDYGKMTVMKYVKAWVPAYYHAVSLLCLSDNGFMRSLLQSSTFSEFAVTYFVIFSNDLGIYDSFVTIIKHAAATLPSFEAVRTRMLNQFVAPLGDGEKFVGFVKVTRGSLTAHLQILDVLLTNKSQCTSGWISGPGLFYLSCAAWVAAGAAASVSAGTPDFRSHEKEGHFPLQLVIEKEKLSQYLLSLLRISSISISAAIDKAGELKTIYKKKIAELYNSILISGNFDQTLITALLDFDKTIDNSEWMNYSLFLDFATPCILSKKISHEGLTERCEKCISRYVDRCFSTGTKNTARFKLCISYILNFPNRFSQNSVPLGLILSNEEFKAILVDIVKASPDLLRSYIKEISAIPLKDENEMKYVDALKSLLPPQ